VNVAFRVDAAAHIGIGHFMRSLTLADSLAARGATCRFVSRHLGAPLRTMLSDRGHALFMLCSPACEPGLDPVPHASWLGTSQQCDASDTLEVLAATSPSWLIVDHYSLDARWEAVLRSVVPRIMAIDDVADRRHDCDVLLDQNLFPEGAARYGGLVADQTVQLLGPRYALLRPEFASLREGTPVRPGPVRHILVSLGGADAGNQTLKVVRALTRLKLSGVEVDVVIGAGHPCRGEVEHACTDYSFNCHVAPRRLAPLMAAADLAVGAAGSTSWERCCLGAPTLIMTQAANQVPIAAGLAASGAAECLGDGNHLDERSIADAIASLMASPARIRSMSAAARDLVDGLGAERVSDCVAPS
jgi:UDP-2,4-diacetamido-2,4,6-trideoxy-beta-L-altropyranose hydrolase